jgi:hypothetical protein
LGLNDDDDYLTLAYINILLNETRTDIKKRRITKTETE